jgi:hypothetical protein
MSIIADPIYDSAAPRISTEFGFPVREDVALTDSKGQPKAKIESAFQKLISKIVAPLRRILEPGETVFLASSGVPPMGALEQLTMSWLMYRYYTVALVFTDRRLLVFGLNGSGKWRGTIKEIRWSQVTKASATGWLTQGLKLKIGKKTFLYGKLGIRSTSRIKKLLPLLTASLPTAVVADPTISVEPRSLCGRCAQHLMPGTYSCQHCGLQLKDEKTLLLRTLIPGGAYFYVGAGAVGVINALVEALFLFEIAVVLLSPDISNRDRGAGATVIGYLVFLIALEKAISYSHARRFVKQFEPVRVEDTNTTAAMAAFSR